MCGFGKLHNQAFLGQKSVISYFGSIISANSNIQLLNDEYVIIEAIIAGVFFLTFNKAIPSLSQKNISP